MAIVIPNEGELLFLARMLNPAGAENYSLKLFTNNYTPVAGSVAGSFTEANFTGYVAKTLAPATFGAPAVVGGVGSSTYGVAQTWTNTGVAQSIYGYWIEGATSGSVYWAERFSSAPRTLNTNDTLSITPVITLT